MKTRSFEMKVHIVAKRFARRYAATEGQRRLFSTILDERGRRSASGSDGVVSLGVHIPWLVAQTVNGDQRDSLPIAVAGMYLYAAMDILDDIVDGDLPGTWRGYRQTEVLIAAGAMLSALPALVLAQIDHDPERKLQMLKRLKRAELATLAGQQRDVGLEGDITAPVPLVEAAMLGKAGEPAAALAALTALYCGCSEREAELYADIGRVIGFNLQVLSDLRELSTAPRGKGQNTPHLTLPVALLLETCPPAERRIVLDRLDACRRRPDGGRDVVAVLGERGTLSACRRILLYYQWSARHALGQLTLPEAQLTPLQWLLDGLVLPSE